MAVNSKADKTGSHKTSAPSSKPSFSAQSALSAGPVLGTAGTKALMLRAKKELAPLEDPNQSIAD